MFTFTFRQEFQDVFAASRVALARQGPARVLGWTLLLGPVMVLATAMLKGWGMEAALRLTLPVLGGCWAVYFLGRPLGAWWLARTAQARAAAAGLERTVTLDDSGVGLTTSAGSAHIPWAGFVKVGETPGVFLLNASAARVLILPKRVMAGEAQVAEVRALIAKHVFGTPGR